MPLPAFKAYDIRGRVPEELNEDLARRIGVALAAQLAPGPVVLGHDVRLTSPALQDALAAGLRGTGREVIDIGLCGTEEVYFQTDHLGAAGGVMVTASHNPMDYNGMKLVKENARPISSDTGLFAISDAVAVDTSEAQPPRAGQTAQHDKSAYIQHLLSYVDAAKLKPLKLVVNAGNGGAGAIVDLLAPHLPFEFIRICHEPDGSFPNGIPNPLLPENRAATANAVREHGADFGIAWDGDFDRCFFFDHTGRFIEGYYLVGLLAKAILARNPGGKIVHDPRLVWNTVEMVEQAGGVPVLCKSGHAFIKEKMRAEDAVYGGEMSAHHYFREFAYADSGMIPWLLIAQLISESGRSLADWVEDRMAAYPCSGEINFKVADAKAAVARVMEHFAARSPALDHTDGISADFGDWRFNLRSSNTEPLLRLNVEARGDAALMQARTDEISRLIQQ
ncbi:MULTISPECIES: phosphomannomutase/phosphoglucomutase [Stenotrophomonas]|jgi:phosphomannomutase/phosphoglucomutase|uniref:phosphomannomutase/phosphoglucomutase n=1 Tax=Stenotrophomonas TaxID=40323 RepID=UPI00066B45F0|nr:MULTISPECIES: phosphomannomutase/phosphoglucomutase [Stenotrophomonas]MBA0420800.1 phosphomannomutase/phosphoglucomutase [Stenotrophomonas maltophilia]MBD3741248.1 phosphomannomutase/phosphoglucomutase [Stenotrophomonas sp.]MBH1656604.1 phosphomannomutase/phosphoglucomutase [Stenotrophomonas maltophilia]MBH1694465.1 phosphomannomutase/phosphoglucomutase [Stenotrophomonas maltophilia]MBH1845408.1 phosphomannomutase/phosphoglucomutase [Stenotrophomonas maltophilia]